MIIQKSPELLKESGRDGIFPISEIISRDNFEIEFIEMMIKKGADPHVLDSNGNSLLHLAVMINRVEYVEKILEFGVDPSMQNKLGYTALHFSCTIESLEIFNLILQSDKIDIECKNYLGDTILHDACRSNFDHHFFSLIKRFYTNLIMFK